MQKQLPMLMALCNNNKPVYNVIKGYYTNEQSKLGRSVKQIERDFSQLTCFGTSTISSSINIDNTKEGRQYWKQVEKQYESIYTNLN